MSQIWPDIRDRKAQDDTWGDEIECQIVRFNHEDHQVFLSLEQERVLSRTPSKTAEGLYDPEFARYMVESSPSQPYTSSIESLLKVEPSLEARRIKVNESLPPNEKMMALSVFPLLGAEPLMDPQRNMEVEISEYDGGISHGPYGIAKDNIEARSRKLQLQITVPVFQDTNTKRASEIRLQHILFGPGACGLQATFQCTTLAEARELHDQLVVLGPIFLALTAATPVYQGLLADTDARWNQTAAAVDDRPDHELKHRRPRWSTAPMYLSGRYAGCNEKESITNGSTLGSKTRSHGQYADFLEDKGIDPIMAAYFAALHLHDPLYLAAKEGRHENVLPEDVHRSICSSVWSHVRLKVPEPKDDDGWRVEFRPMEVQLNSFDNAAFLIFLGLVRQLLKSQQAKHLNLFMPLHLVAENMDRAHERNAVKWRKFWFPSTSPRDGTSSGNDVPYNVNIHEWSIDEIVNGAEDGSFSGLAPLMEEFLQASREDLIKLQPYLDLVRDRARGTSPTPACWMRNFCTMHPDYRYDSIVGQSVCYDMLRTVEELSSCRS